MSELSILLALSYFIFCGTLVLAHSHRSSRVTLLDWSLMAMGGMYGLGWVIVILSTDAGLNPVWGKWISPYSHLYWAHTVAALGLTLGTLGGWYLLSARLPLSITQHTTTPSKFTRQLSRLLWLAFLASIVLQGIYAHAYGGYMAALEYSSAIRSSRFGEVPENPWSFLKPFSGLALVTAHGFFGLWLSGWRTALSAAGLVLSISFSFYILYSQLGRVGVLVFILTFPLAVILTRDMKPWRLVVGGAALFFILLILSYNLSIWMNLKSADSFFEFLARELAFPFGSFFAQLEQGQNLFRGFVDFIVAPIYFLPSSWWSTWYLSASQANTALIMGAPKGEAGVTGGIPTDLITLGLMQVHLPGILIIGFLFGISLRVLQWLIIKVPAIGVRSTLEASLAISFATLGVFYSQPNLVLIGHFPLIFFVAFAIAVACFRRLLKSLLLNPETTIR